MPLHFQGYVSFERGNTLVTYEEYLREYLTLAIGHALLHADQADIIFLSNATDSDPTKGMRSMQRLDALGHDFSVIDIPLFGEMDHNERGSCPHDFAELRTVRRCLREFVGISFFTQYLPKIVAVGCWARAALCFKGLGEPIIDIAQLRHVSYFTYWGTAERFADVFAVLDSTIDHFWPVDHFEAVMRETQTTERMRAAARLNIQAIKHLPASAKQKAAASRTGQRVIHDIKHLPASAKQKAAASRTGQRVIHDIKHLPASAKQKAAARRTGMRTIWMTLAKCRIRGRTAAQNIASAANARTPKARASSSINGSIYGAVNFAAARANPNWRSGYLSGIRQLSPETVTPVLQHLFDSGEPVTMLRLSYIFCKQEARMREFLTHGMEDNLLAERFSE